MDTKKILVICTNPASSNLLAVDTTTNYLMNNLFAMGYSTITLCNLFAEITNKLKPAKAEDNADNMVSRFELFGSDAKGLYMLDSELAGRTYSAPSLTL